MPPCDDERGDEHRVDETQADDDAPDCEPQSRHSHVPSPLAIELLAGERDAVVTILDADA